ncbi:MAG: YicC family protein [Bacteroidales bacterium]|nr:YicC family protein [Bacteroidales bacterium]
MIKSMTGFGKAELNLPDKKVTIEVKSLNSKQLDMNVRMSGVYREKELEVRSQLAASLNRGKVEAGIFIDVTGEVSNFKINKPLAKHYYEELKALNTEIGHSSFEDYLPVIVRMPDVMKPERQELDPEEWKQVSQVLVQAINDLNAFRIKEGEVLLQDFVSRTGLIEDYLEEITTYEQERVEVVRTRLQKDLSDIIADGSYDKNRLEQELIYYLEKLDITEEKVRLRNHCEYFRSTLNEKESMGKKLGFIVQEMGREINTIGSKANHASIQKLVVQMKDELEKMKEQLFNIL